MGHSAPQDSTEVIQAVKNRIAFLQDAAESNVPTKQERFEAVFEIIAIKRELKEL